MGNDYASLSKGKRTIIYQLVHHVPNITVGKKDDIVIPQLVNQEDPKRTSIRTRYSGRSESK